MSLPLATPKEGGKLVSLKVREEEVETVPSKDVSSSPCVVQYLWSSSSQWQGSHIE